MRLFVAVQLPEDVLDQVDAVSTALRDELESSDGRGGKANHGGSRSGGQGRGEDSDAGGQGRRAGSGSARLRWTTREQWHITLRFLGEVADPTEVVEALDGLWHPGRSDSSRSSTRASDRSGGSGRPGPSAEAHGFDESGHKDAAVSTGYEGAPYLEGVEAELRLRPTVLGGSVLCLPVHGLDELARAVANATAHIGQPPDPRPFRGHVTLARQRGRQHRRLRLGDFKVPGPDRTVEPRWRVSEVHVMRSHLHRDGSLYEVLSTMSWI